MAESNSNRPTRTLSDIRRPSQVKTAPAPVVKKPAKKATPAVAPAPAVSSPAVASSPQATTKKKRSIWKGVLTAIVILVLIAAVAAVYYYIFSA